MKHLPLIFITAAFLPFANAAPRDTPSLTPGAGPVIHLLEEWIHEVDTSSRHFYGLYDLPNARKNLDKAFANGGVVWSRRYAEAWGGWIYTDWDVAVGLHKRTRKSLQDNIDAIIARKPVGTTSQMVEENRARMAEFRRQCRHYETLFEHRLTFNVRQGLELDQANYHQRRSVAASLTGNSELAESERERAEHFRAKAEVWRKRGAEASGMIRTIGYGKKPIAPEFTQSLDRLGAHAATNQG